MIPSMPRSVFILTLLAAAAPVAFSQMPPIGIIDVYGIRTVREDHVRGLLRIAVGDSFPSSVAAAERRLAAIPGVIRATITGTCCDAGKSIMFVGIEETASAAPRFRPEPDGFIYLPQDILQTGATLDAAREAAVLRGQAGEDQSAGHSLMEDSAGRALQLRFIGFAVRDSARLRDVLLYSNDA